MDKILDELKKSMNVFDTIFIIGAGVSMKSGMPNVSLLSNILWKIFEDTTALEKLKDKIKTNDLTAKKIIGQDFSKIKIAFEIVENDINLLNKFKHMFREQSYNKCFNSKFHKKLAELIHENKVKKVISMNWDNLLETAWHELYGTTLDSNIIIKPHGDVNVIDSRWTLPNSEGTVSDEMKQILSNNNKKPLNIVIVGYSENDQFIKKEFIDVLEKNNSVYRVNPSCSGENSILMYADEFVSDLTKYFKFKNKGWEYLNFDNQEDVSNIVLNEKLTHLNSKNSPHFDNFSKLYDYLKNNDVLVLSGFSGTGKTFTAYQIAYEFNLKNYEVVYLKGNVRTTPEITCRFKSIIIIDNANNYKNLVNSLVKKTNKNFKLIIIYSINNNCHSYELCLEKYEKFDLSFSKASVEKMHNFFVENKRVLEPIINNNYNYTNDFFYYDSLIDSAKNQITPYYFMYVIKGKKNAIKQYITEIKIIDHFDLFAFIAMYQIINLDSYISLKKLKDSIDSLKFLHQLDKKFASKFLANKSNKSFSFDHLQAAYIYLRYYILDKDFSFNKFREMFNYLIDNKLYVCVGLGNFIDSVENCSVRFPHDFRKKLIEHLIKYKKHEDGILYAIAKLIFADEMLLIEKKEDITNVINEINDKIDFYALSNIVNNLNNFVISNKQKKNDVEYYWNNINFNHAVNCIDLCSLFELRLYADLIETCAFCMPDLIWENSFAKINSYAMLYKINNCEYNDLYFISLICKSFSFKNDNRFTNSFFKRLCMLMKKSVLPVLDKLENLFCYYLLGCSVDSGYIIDVNDEIEKNRKLIVDNIDVNIIKNEIENIYLEEAVKLNFIGDLIRNVDPSKHALLIKSLDLNKIAISCSYFIGSDTFNNVLGFLYDEEDNFASKLIYIMHDKIKKIDSITCFYAPKFCIDWINLNKKINLFDKDVSSNSIEAIIRIFKFDVNVGLKLIKFYKDKITIYIKNACFDNYDYSIKEKFYMCLKKNLFLNELDNIDIEFLLNWDNYNKNITYPE